MSKKSWVPTQFGWEEIEETNEDEDQDQEYFPYVEDVNDYDEDEDYAGSYLEEEQPEKREDADFWAARGKKEDADFWATRG
jgi:hypothetical protein